MSTVLFRIACLLAVLELAVLAQPTTPTFRASADLVSVDVSVRAGNTPITTLTSADFVVYDNGVRQQILAISASTVPLDITVIVDVSADQAEFLDSLRADLRAIARLLQPTERLRVWSFGNEVVQVFGFQSPSASQPVERIATGGFSAVHEALVAALVHPVPPSRRHLVVAFTNAFDNRSVLPATAVGLVARRTEAVLHLVVPSRPLQNWMQATEFLRDRGFAAQRYPPLLLGESHPRFRDAVIEAAESTGGAVHTTSGRGDRASILPTVQQILKDYRSGYLLQYQPTGVDRDGWHELRVEVARRGRMTIRARRGYLGGDRLK